MLDPVEGSPPKISSPYPLKIFKLEKEDKPYVNSDNTKQILKDVEEEKQYLTKHINTCRKYAYTLRHTYIEGVIHFFLFFFLWPYLQHMEVPRPEVKSEL